MTTDRELMQQALDALEGYARNCRCEGGGAPCDAAEVLRVRLAQPEQEPVAWITDGGKGELWWHQSVKFDDDGNLIGENPDDIPLYTAPPQQHSEQWWRHEVSNAWAEGYEKGRASVSVKQPEQEPVATLFGSLPVYDVSPKRRKPPTQDLSAPLTVNGVPMYPQREWQGLTDEEMFSLWVRCPAETEDRFAFARAIEAKLKAKNA